MTSLSMKRPFLFSGGLAVVVFYSACKDKQDIQVYRVAKELPGAQMADNSSMPPVPQAPSMAAGSGPAIADTPPSGWEAQPPSSMRLASYLVKGENGAIADVSLVALGGGAGGVLDNVNRWLAQLGQPAITEGRLNETAQRLSSSLGDVTVMNLEGLPQGGDALKDGRILAGILSSSDRTIFFKMRGNAALVEAQKAEFVKWIASVQFKP